MSQPTADHATGHRPTADRPTAQPAQYDATGGKPGRPSPIWCDRCGGPLAGGPLAGGPLADGTHEACRAARTLEPPRFCPLCRRRMRVQVLPAGWRAGCVKHGQVEPT